MARAARWLFLLLLIYGALAQQVHALDPCHDHRSASEHCCRLCHAGHPILVAAGAPMPAPDTPSAWLPPNEDESEYHECGVSLASSRAPPL